STGTKPGLRGGPFALLPGVERDALAALHAAVSSDWGPRDAYERHWVMELVGSLCRQDRLRDLELATLTAAAAESPPSDATVRKLGTYARYGARIDKDIGRALQALRVLRKRPDAWVAELRECTHEPGEPDAATQNFTNELSPCTFEPENPEPQEANYTIELAARTFEPETAPARCARPPQRNMAAAGGEGLPLADKQGSRRPLAAMRREAFDRAFGGNRFDRAALLASGIHIPEIAAPRA
ncbi:MAG: hypothetical protein AB7O95_30465, partial [Geminicoccaceae bacterium]